MDNQLQFYRFKRDELVEIVASQLKKGDSIALAKQSEPIYGAAIIDDVWPIQQGQVTIVYTLPKGASIDSHAAFLAVNGTADEFVIQVTQKISLSKVVLICRNTTNEIKNE